MDLPDTKATFNPAADVKDLTIKDFFNAKEKALPTWSMMGFQKFVSFCRRAQRLCQASKKDGAAANAAALGVLMDIALRVYKTMERLGELGPEEIRFKARMYIHLQHMSVHRVLHASAIANTVFADATNAFVARLPAYKKMKKDMYGGLRKPPVDQNKLKQPVSGCYLCTATDHYSNDTRFHPLLPDGTREKVPEKMKKAILERIDKSNLAAAVKASEKEKVQSYWLQHSL